MVIPVTPLTDAEVASTLANMEDVIRYRLRMSDIIPVEMSQHRIGIALRTSRVTQLTSSTADGRVYFTAPKLFEASLCLRGGQQDDGWFFVHVEFLITIGGDMTGLQGREVPPSTAIGV